MGYKVESLHAAQKYYYRTKSLQRKTPTSERTASRTDPCREILWNELRANKLGVQFRRQQVIAGFIVNFYCYKEGLVIEVDGDIHDLRQAEDKRREKALSEIVLRVTRFRNDEVEKDLADVIARIRALLTF